MYVIVTVTQLYNTEKNIEDSRTNNFIIRHSSYLSIHNLGKDLNKREEMINW